MLSAHTEEAKPDPPLHCSPAVFRGSGYRTTASASMPDAYSLGLFLLIVVVFLWTSSNFITQNLFDDGFQMPFLVTYFNTASFSLYLLPLIFYRWRQDSTYTLSTDNLEGVLPPAEGRKAPPMSIRETANLAIVFCFLWFIANWSQNASLEYTSVASSTILASTSGFFTLLVGRTFRVEPFSVIRLGTVITSFLGVVLVSLADSETTNATTTVPSFTPDVGPLRRPPLGDALALLSAIFYAFYVILLKVRIRDESRVNMQLFFGFVGLFNVLCLWPIGFLLHWTGLEPFRLPSSKMQLAAVAMNMAITLSSDYIYVLAMLKTTPLVVTVGISLTIPCALLGDLVLGVNPRLQVAAGAMLVIASFMVLGVEDSVRRAWAQMGSVSPRGVLLGDDVQTAGLENIE